MTQHERTQPLHPDDGEFTPQQVHSILRENVLKNDRAKLPPRNATAVRCLANALNELRREVHNWQGEWRERLERVHWLQEVVPKAIELMQKERRCVAAELGYLERHAPKPMAAAARADVAAYDRFISSAQALRGNIGKAYVRETAPFLPLELFLDASLAKSERGLIIVTLPDEPIARWHHFASRLERIFHEALPDAGKEAAYRFIVEVTPMLTGEKPGYSAVRTELVRKRGLKRKSKN